MDRDRYYALLVAKDRAGDDLDRAAQATDEVLASMNAHTLEGCIAWQLLYDAALSHENSCALAFGLASDAEYNARRDGQLVDAHRRQAPELFPAFEGDECYTRSLRAA